MEPYQLVLFVLNCFALLFSLAMVANPNTEDGQKIIWFVIGAINALAVGLRLTEVLL